MLKTLTNCGLQKDSARGFGFSMRKRILLFLICTATGFASEAQVLIPFVKRYDVTQPGALVMIGNTILTCDGGPPASGSVSCGAAQAEVPPSGTSRDNNFNSDYIDIDSDPSTFSSSSADLNLSTCSKITFAGLYWAAYISSGTPNFAQRNEVKIKTPGSSVYTSLVADTAFDLNNGYDYYSCFKDVTSLLAGAGNGTYTLADLVSKTGGTNEWAGWGIVIVYKNELMTAKNLTVFDGLGYVANSGGTVTVGVNGFYTPPGGAVNFELGEIAFDGDRGLTGDSMLFKGGASFIPISDALHTTNDLFNSSIANNAVENLSRNPAYSNTLGYDQCIFKPDNSAKNYLPNGATSAQIKVTTGGEQIFLRVLTSSIDTYEPVLAMKKSVVDIDGGQVNPGDTLLYTITVNNNGNDTSSTTTVTDTLPFNCDYIANSTIITSGPNLGAKTDVSGDDQADFATSGIYKILKVRLGNGADGTSGGQMPHIGATSSTRFTFKVQITNDCTKLLCNPVISNRASINYSGYISGLPRRGNSNPQLLDSLGCPVEGFTSTTITVPVSCSPPPDSSIGGCLPIVFSSVPGIRPNYSYYNSSWSSVTQANVTGIYHGIRVIPGTSCADTINYNVYVAIATSANAGPDKNLCAASNTTLAGNTATVGTGTWSVISGPNSPTFSAVNSPTSNVNGLVSGIYSLAWKISTGCNSSVDTMIINNYALPTTANAGSNQSLCNVSSANLTGNAPVSGTGIWTLVSGPNVPSIASPTNPTTSVNGLIEGVYVFRWTITNSVCAPSSADVQISIFNLPTTSNAGPDQALCNLNSATLSGNSPTTGNGVWTLVSGPNAPTITSPAIANTGVTGLIAGTYIFRWTISNGVCTPSTDDIQIIIYALASSADAGPDQNLCNVTSTNFAAVTPIAGNGTWTLVSGPNAPVIALVTDPTSSVTGMISGVYIFRWTVTNGVCASTNDDVQITIFALPTISSAGPDQSLCNVTSTTMAANAPTSGTGNWSFVSGPNAPSFVSTSNPTTVVNGLISGTYFFRWQISNGTCAPSSDNVKVIVFGLPTVSNAGPDQNLCNVTSTTLTANNPVVGTGGWTLVSGPSIPSFSSTTSSTISVSGLTSGVYVFRWTISNGVCTPSTDDIQVTIYDLSTISDAGPDQNLCNVTTSSLAGNTPTFGSGVWTLTSGPNSPTISSPTSPTSGITGLTFGTYIFTWTITNGVCSSTTDDIQIIVYELPTVSNAGPDQNLCNFTSTSFAGNTPTVGVGAWSLISGPNSPTITLPSSPTSSLTGMIAGVYIFRWTISNGVCTSSTDDIQINNYALPTVANAGVNQNLCNVSSTILTGNNPAIGTGAWSVISGPNVPTITTPSAFNSTVTGMIPGVYMLRWTITSGVCATSFDAVQITNYATPTTSNAGLDQNLCNVNNTTLSGNAPVNGSGVWTLISGPNVPAITSNTNPTTTVTGMIKGVYVFRWTISNGVCISSTDDIQVTIYSLPTIANAGPDQNLCNVTSTTLAGNNAVIGTGNWTLLLGPNAPVITSPSSPTTTVTGMIPGIYFFRWSITNGVCAPSIDDVQIINYDLPTTSDAGVDQFLCNVSTTTLNGNVPAVGNGNWSFVSGPNVPSITSVTANNSTVTGMIAGVYVFKWTISNGVCATSTDNVSITNYSLPTTAAVGPDQNLCSVSSTSISGNTPTVGTGLWSLVSGPNIPSISNPSSANTTVTGLIFGTYAFSWTITSGVCASSSATINVTVFNQPTTIDAGPDQSLCNVTSTTMAGNVPSAGTGTWTQISGPNSASITDPNDPSTSILALTFGTYQFTWEISNGPCITPTDTVMIVVYDNPTVSNAGPNQDLCSVTAITLNGNAPAIGNGIWTLNSGPNVPMIVDSSLNNTAVNGMINGTYLFDWTISSGPCVVSVSTVQITIYNAPLFVDAGPDQNLCNINSTTMAANTPSVGTGTWTFISGPNVPTIDTVNSPTTPINGLVIGTYLFGWSISNGVCVTNVDTIIVTNYDLPTNANAGADQNLCNVDSSAFSGNTPLVGSGIWSTISGPNVPTITDSSSANSEVHGLISGTYLFAWTITSGVCSTSVDTMQITIYGVSVSSSAGADQSLCNIDSVVMNGNTPVIGSGNWSMASGPNVPTITNSSDPTTSITGLIAGNYVFVWSIVNGVCAPATDSIEVNIYDLPTIAVAGPDENLCNIYNTNLSANTPTVGAGLWTLISGPNVPSIAVPSDPASPVSGLISGTYQFLWSISNGVCTSTVDTIQLNVFDLPTVANAGPDQQLCANTTTTLAGNVTVVGSGLWTLISGPNVPVIVDSTNESTDVNGMIAGDYIFEWSISNGSCTTTMDDMQVSIYQFPPIVNAGADQNLCNVNTVSLSGNSPSAGSGTWSFISGPNSPTISAPTSPSTNVSGVVAGTYLFAWNIVNGVCAVYGDTVQVTIDALPTISNAGTDGSFCNVNSVTLNGDFAASGNGLWNQISGPNSSTIVSPNSGTSTVNGMIAGTYQFTWTISNGICSASTDTVQFSIYDLPLTVDAGSDQSLCNSNSVTMGGNVPTTGTGSWTLITGPNNPAIVSVNNPSTLITGLIPGNYIFGWTINNGLCSTITDSVSITNDGTPTVALAGTDQTRCNDTSTTLNGNTPVTGSGTWTQVSGPNAATIFSQTDPFTLIENLVPGVYSFVWTIDNGVCASSNDTVKITINSLANIANAGADQSLCNQSSVTMFANSSGVGSGNWTLISGPNVPVIVNPVNENTDVTGMIAGTYIFRWTISNSICTSTFDDVQIVIFDSPAITSAGIDQFLCNTNSTTLAANTPTAGTGTWTLITGPNIPTFTLPNNENSTVTGMTEGIYQFGWMISNGNCASVMDTVQIENYNLPSVADAGIDQNICANSILTLDGNNPSSGSGMWTQISGPNSTFINSPSSPVTIDSAFVAGTYTFTWAISNGVCATSTDTVQITILDLPNVAFAGNDQRLCNANLISIAGNNPINGVGVWTLVSGPNVPTILAPDSTMTDVIGTTPGNYIFRWTISNSTCSATYDDVLITIDSVPTAVNAGLDQSWCSLNTVQLQGNIPVVGSGSWIFISGPNVPTIDFPLSENSTVSSLVQGTYEFRWTVINGTCESFDEVQIVLNAPPVVTVTQNLFTTCEGVRTATLEASGASTYLWSPTTNLSNSSISNPTLTIDQALIYTVIGTDANGCSASDTVTIEICDTINIPSGFSPDGDGINDNFEIVGIENYPDNVLRVFNRWGNLLYEKKKYNNSWNGIPNVNSLIIGNGKVTSGTYFYILELGANDKTKTGYIIIRY